MYCHENVFASKIVVMTCDCLAQELFLLPLIYTQAEILRITSQTALIQTLLVFFILKYYTSPNISQ